jgi:GMP synthase-like glutamine amidotransferase
MRFLVFQHVAAEHPGVLRELMRADSIAWDTVELDEGVPIPAFDGYHALLVFGGPMDVWQEDRHPWLAREKAAIRCWVVEKKAPFLGVCLGHQLLADALGGTVGLMANSEVGVFDVKLTGAGRRSPLFAGMPAVFPALHWHSAEVSRLPSGAVTLAGNDHCAIQALRVGEKAYGIQCHFEQDEGTVREWGEITEYRAALENIMGPGGQEQLQRAANQNMAAFARAARTIYGNFRRLVAD